MKVVKELYDKESGETLNYTPEDRLNAILNDWLQRDKAKDLETYQRYLDTFRPDFKDKVVVDVGCGAWGGILNFAKDAKRTYAIDPLIAKYIELGLYKIVPSTTFGDSAEEIWIPDNYVDLVFCLNTLDHCNNIKAPQKIISEIHRILKPKGKAYIFLHFRGENLGLMHYYSLDEKDLKKYFKDFHALMWKVMSKDTVWERDIQTFWGVFEK